MKKKAKGGNVKRTNASAKVEIAEKSAFVAVPVPKPAANPQVCKAENIDDALQHLNVNFNVKLRKQDGSSNKEVIEIRGLEDFDETDIASKSDVLREMQQQLEFLHDFQDELQHNPTFREELKEYLESETKEAFLEKLKTWRTQLKDPTPQFIHFLKS